MGLASIRSLGSNGVEVVCGSSIKNALGFKSKYCSEEFIHPPFQKQEVFIECLLDRLDERDIDCVLPGAHPSLSPLIKNREKISVRSHDIFPDDGILDTLMDKGKMTRFAGSSGVGVPNTLYSIEGLNEKEILEVIRFPVLIKPVYQAGSIGIEKAEAPRELMEKYSNNIKLHGPCIVQELIRGKPIIFSGLFNREGEVRRICVSEKVREHPLSGGPATCSRTVRSDEVVEVMEGFFKDLGYFGVVSADIIIDESDGKPRLIDCNPRFYGSMATAIAAGVDFPYLLYRMMRDGDIEKKLGYQVGIQIRDFLVGDRKILVDVFKGKKEGKKKYSRIGAAKDYINFFAYHGDFLLSLTDPGPGMHEFSGLVKRSLS